MQGKENQRAGYRFGWRIKEVAESCGTLRRKKERPRGRQERTISNAGYRVGDREAEKRIRAESALCAANPGPSRRVDHCAISSTDED